MYYAAFDRAWQELTAPGAPFETRVESVGGVDLRVYASAPRTLRDVWLATAPLAERDYLVFQDERLTYDEAHRQVTAIARWLVDHGVRPGDRVAIAMRNYPEWITVYWACACIGAAAVGMNAWWTAAEMGYGLDDSRPKVLFCDDQRMARLSELEERPSNLALVAVRTPAVMGAVPMGDVLATSGVMPEVRVEPDTSMCIFYTSGTTGFPKGAELTHRSCANNLMNMAFAGQVAALAAERYGGSAETPSVAAPWPVALITTPLFHVSANNCTAQATTAAGGKLVLMYRWDAGEALKLIAHEQCTSVIGVPVMAREILAHPDFAQCDTSSVATLGGGGAQLPPDLVEKIDRAPGGARPITGYGLTETSGIVTSISGDAFTLKPSSCGRAMPNYEVKIVDDQGAVLSVGEIGELCVRGSSVIKGYINRPEATAETIVDGWLHTGDLAYLDADQFIFLVDRKKDLVLRGGENISCVEVEAALHRHPDVVECAVFGVLDTRLGEEVGAAVLLRPGSGATAESLRRHCAALIAKYKAPRYVWLLDQPLPRNASGKFLKRELREGLLLQDAG